jgi:hypothetical protein
MLLNLTGLFLGDIFYESGIETGANTVYIITAVFLAGFVFYPLKGEKSRFLSNYAFRKTFDFILIFSTFLLVISFGSGSEAFSGNSNNAHASTVETETEESPGKNKRKKKDLRKKITDNLRVIQKLYKQGSRTEKGILIALTILVAALAFYILLAWSCSISCSGLYSSAIIVGILGTGIIIFITIRVIRGINRKAAKKISKTDS